MAQNVIGLRYVCIGYSKLQIYIIDEYSIYIFVMSVQYRSDSPNKLTGQKQYYVSNSKLDQQEDLQQTVLNCVTFKF